MILEFALIKCDEVKHAIFKIDRTMNIITNLVHTTPRNNTTLLLLLALPGEQNVLRQEHPANLSTRPGIMS